jgi:hypothetical protein
MVLGRVRAQGEDPASNPASAYPAPRFSAAVVQLEAIHEECIPALVHLLRLNAVEPMVYLNDRILRYRPGLRARFPELKGRVKFVPVNHRNDWARLHRRIEESEPDLLVVNTYQNPGPVGWSSQWKGPMLGVVHNATLIAQTPLAHEMVARGRVGVLTLAPHVTARLMADDPQLYAGAASITAAGAADRVRATDDRSSGLGEPRLPRLRADPGRPARDPRAGGPRQLPDHDRRWGS